MPVRAWDLTSTRMTSAQEVRVITRIFPKSEQLLSLGLMLTLYYNSEIHAEQETKTCSRVSPKPFSIWHKLADTELSPTEFQACSRH